MKALLSSLKTESLNGLHACKDFDSKFEKVEVCHGIEKEIISLQTKDNNKNEEKEKKVFDSLAFQNFQEWLDTNGVSFGKVKFEYIQELGCNGVVCTEDISEGATAFEVPRKTMITKAQVMKSKVWQDIYQHDTVLQKVPHLVLVLSLLTEKLLGDVSFFKPYIDILPTTFPTLPITWEPEHIKLLKGTSAEQPGTDRKFNCWSYYCHIMEILEFAAKRYPKRDLPTLVRKREQLTLELFTWALCISMTRQNQIPEESASKTLPASKSQELALIPVFDMCNHEAGVGFSTSYESGRLVCAATRNFEKGKEFRIFYGTRPNAQLLIYSGFVLPPGVNQSECFLLKLEQPNKDDDPLLGIKKLFMKRFIHPSKTMLRLGKGDYYRENMKSALEFARIMSLNKEEASQVLKNDIPGFDAPLSERNEDAALAYLNGLVSDIRAKTLTTLEDFKHKWSTKYMNENKTLYNMVLNLLEGECKCLEIELKPVKA